MEQNEFYFSIARARGKIRMTIVSKEKLSATNGQLEIILLDTWADS